MNKVKSQFTSKQKYVIALLALTQFTVILDFMVMSPLGDFLIKSLNISTTQFGFAVSCYAFSAGISGLLTAGFADRYDRKKLLLFFYVGFIVGTFLCGIAPSYPLLIAARIITGLFGGVIGSIGFAIITDLFDLQHRGRVMGFVQMGFAASQVLGIPIGIYIANKFDWHAPFLMIVVLAFIIAFMIYKKLPPIIDHLTKGHDRNVVEHFVHVFTNPKYRLGFIATSILATGGFMMMPFGSAFAINNLKVTSNHLPIIFMASGLSSLIIMPVIGKLSDKFDRFKIFAFGSLWGMIFIMIYTHLGPSPLSVIIPLNICVFIGIMSRMIPVSTIGSAVPALPDRGAYMSINASIQQIAGGLAAAFAGMIVHQKDKFSPLENYPMLGFITSFMMLITIYLVYLLNNQVKGNKATSPEPPVVLLE